MRSSTGLAVLSALCAVAAVLLPEPAVLLQLLKRGGGGGGGAGSGSALPPLHPSPASLAGAGQGQGCPLGFGSLSSLTGKGRGDDAVSDADDASRRRAAAASPERRTWYVGAGGGWTGAEDAEEGPLWLEPGGGFAVDGTGDVVEVAATEAEARAAVARDAAEGRLSGGAPVALQGAYVIPGIVDAHVHLIPAGLALTSHADLRGVASRDAFEAAVGQAARRLLQSVAAAGGGGGVSALDCGNDGEQQQQQQQPLPWLMGGWWDESQWPGAEMPAASWVDGALERAAAEADAESASAAEGRCLRALPVLLSRMDGHMGVANRAALELARAALRRGGHEQDAAGGAVAEGARELLASAEAPLTAAAASTSTGSKHNRFVDLDPRTGATTGLVREAGLLAVARAAPPPTLAARRAALESAARVLLSRGVTAVGDMGRSPFAGGDPSASWDDLEELYDPAAAAAAAEGGDNAHDGGGGGGGQGRAPFALPLRIAAYLPLETWPRLAARVAARGAVSGLLHAAGVKTFWDGSLGSRTALMTEPYEEEGGGGAGGGEGGGGGGGTKSGTNNNNNRGVRMVDSPEETALAMRRADAAGLQPAVHAIGDAAVDEATAALATVAEARSAAAGGAGGNGAPPPPPLPLRLEHVQHLSGREAARRLANLTGAETGEPAVAVINPQHLVSDARLMPSLPRAVRAAGDERTHAWRSLARAGVPLAIGSDWPVVDLDPWASLWAAVHRSAVGVLSGDQDNKQRGEGAGLRAEEALRAATAGAAFATGLDAWCGRLVPGLKADFVLLETSPFENNGGGANVSLARARPRVLATYVGGVLSFDAASSSSRQQR